MLDELHTHAYLAAQTPIIMDSKLCADIVENANVIQYDFGFIKLGTEHQSTLYQRQLLIQHLYQKKKKLVKDTIVYITALARV